MEVRTAIEKYETNNYLVESIEYIKGILHSYAEINEPESNLIYNYEIIELDKSENVVDQIKERFYVFEKQPLELKSLSQELFNNFLKKWFFKAGEISKLKISDRKQDNQCNYFLKLLNEVLDVIEIFEIGNLKDEFEIQHLDSGVYYDYFFLIGKRMNYILYFRYDD